MCVDYFARTSYTSELKAQILSIIMSLCILISLVAHFCDAVWESRDALPPLHTQLFLYILDYENGIIAEAYFPHLMPSFQNRYHQIVAELHSLKC